MDVGAKRCRRGAVRVVAPSERGIVDGVLSGSGPLGDSAFEDNAELRSVNISCKTLTCLGNSAFHHCSRLTLVRLSGCAVLTSIGSRAFGLCTALASLDLSNCSALHTFRNCAFQGCASLTSLDLSGCTALKTLGNYAFYMCVALASLDLSGCTALQTLGSYAFEGCAALPSLDLSGCLALRTLGSGAFHQCVALSSVLLPAALASHNLEHEDNEPFGVDVPLPPAQPFQGCASLAKVEFVHQGTCARATLHGVTSARVPAGLSVRSRPFIDTALISIRSYGWGRVRAFVRMRRVAFFWYSLTAERHCAPSGAWAERDREAYEADFA
jgi:hypothetical protein